MPDNVDKNVVVDNDHDLDDDHDAFKRQNLFSLLLSRVDKLKECFCVRVERWSDQAAPTVISDICVCTACCSFPVFPLYFFIVFLWHFFDIFVCNSVCPFVPVFLYYIYYIISTTGLLCLLVINAFIDLNF